MTTTLTRDIDHPDITAFLTTLEPNALLTETRAALDALDARSRDQEGRRHAIAARIAAIDERLADADGKERTALANERAALSAEAQALPTALATLRRRRAPLHLRWLAEVHRLAVAAAAAAIAEMEPVRATVRGLRRDLDRHDARTFGEPLFTDAEADQKRAQTRTLAADIAPLEDRRRHAQLAADVVVAMARQRYGPDVQLQNERTWDAAIERQRR